jgi:hypothetical protein
MQWPINNMTAEFCSNRYTTREELLEMKFSIGSDQRLYRDNKLDNLFSQEYQGVGAMRSREGVTSQQGQEPLEMEAEESALLAAIT